MKEFKFWLIVIRRVCLLNMENYFMMRGDKFIVDKVLRLGLNVYKRKVFGYRRFY